MRAGDEDEDEEVWPEFQVGSAHVTLYERQITAAERKRWAKEDAERDARRIPIGFRQEPPDPQ
jgi:hypothetical protein